jgi:hypothetical protein
VRAWCYAIKIGKVIESNTRLGKKDQADTCVSGACDSGSGIACMCGSGGLDSGDSSSDGGGDG